MSSTELSAAVTPASTVAVKDEFLQGGGVVWCVLVNDAPVGAFTEADDFDAEEAAHALRRKYEDRISALTERAVLVQGIRDMAAFLQEHPDVPCNYVSAGTFGFRTSVEEFRAACEALLPLGAIVGEIPIDRDIHVAQRFGPVHFDVRAEQSKVCEERWEVKEVTEYVLPDWARSSFDTEVGAEAA